MKHVGCIVAKALSNDCRGHQQQLKLAAIYEQS